MKTAQDTKSYKQQLKEALGDQFLRTALDTFNTVYRKNRPTVYQGIDFEGIKKEIAAGKDAVLPRLMDLFEEFKVNAEAAGAKVHVAQDAREANEIIADIGKENNVRKIIKAKSMTAEETFLNDYLEKEGFTVTETDLGERIIQLRHEGPSHMVMPAIHLSRYQVGDLFEEVTQKKQDSKNIDKLVKVARQELRLAFLEADMGISGANFAIAESGTLGLVTNEGNMRLVTTLPKVHVALVGYDKLIPDLKSMLRILKVLPRNATGQAITSYVTWIKGATECSSAPSNRKKMHIVFLDNGRLALAKDTVFVEALRCIRCGACANVCPVYSKVGGHKYGHVYIGAIGLILTLFYHGKENDRAIVRNCINCQACKEVCPVDIDLPHLIKKTYRAVLDQEGKTPVKNLLLAKVMKNRKLFHFILRHAYLAQKPLAKNKPMIRHLPHFFEKEHGFRSLPVIAKTSFRDQWKQLRPQVVQPKYTIGFFAGCAIDFIYPEQAKALFKLLKGHDVQVEFPMEQTCCGLPALMMAEEETAKEVALQNIKAMQPRDYDYILTLCASCASHLKHNYPKIFKEDPDTLASLKLFADKIIDFSSFMVNVLNVSAEEFEGIHKKVAYHSPCHLCRGLHVVEEPRKLIELAGYEYVRSKDEDVCCGFGGSYSVDFPEISSAILKKKLDTIEDTDAQLLVTDCPGCVIQLRGGMDKRRSKIQVKHIAEVLAEGKK
ncbi:MAG: LUD domain-containing protein [Thermodesulfobacteriota bacterium]|nr:LUD domain-containing protein [Thermodesulfobacteriota bacterium]